MSEENTKMENIKIELELNPATALLLGTLIHQSSQGSLEILKILTEDGREELMELGQNIVDQVVEKTDFPSTDFRNN